MMAKIPFSMHKLNLKFCIITQSTVMSLAKLPNANQTCRKLKYKFINFQHAGDSQNCNRQKTQCYL